MAQSPVSVLSDGTILELVERGRIRIDPWDPRLVQPASVDLRLGDSFRVFHNHRASAIDLRNPPSGLTEEVDVPPDESFVIHPGEFCLGRTLEWVELPDDVVARIEGKALALDTEVPTPSGWTTMRQLEVGDWVLDSERRPTPVIAATDTIHGRPCRAIAFSDGSEIIADIDHRWPVCGPDGSQRVMTTGEIEQTLGRGHCLPCVPHENFAEHPIRVSGQPIRPARRPIRVGRQPNGLGGGPIRVDPRPIRVGRQPNGLGGGPIRVDPRPSRAVRLPNGLGGRPICVDPQPSRVGHQHVLTSPKLRAEPGFVRLSTYSVLQSPNRHPNSEFGRLSTLARASGPAAAYYVGRPRTITAVRGCNSVPVRCIQVAALDGIFLITRSFIPTHNSSLGRLGLIVHATAGFCDPGWKGTLTLELNNLTRVPIKLYPGLAIAQLSFMALDQPARRPYGSPELGSHYQGQRAATESRYEGLAGQRSNRRRTKIG